MGKFLGTEMTTIGRISQGRKESMRPLLRGSPKLFPKKEKL